MLELPVLYIYVDASTVERRGRKEGLGGVVIESLEGVLYTGGFQLGPVKGSTFSEFKALEVVLDKLLGTLGKRLLSGRKYSELRFLVDNDSIFRLLELNLELRFPKRKRIRDAMLRLMRKRQLLEERYKVSVSVQKIERTRNKADRVIREEFPWMFKKGLKQFSVGKVFTLGDIINFDAILRRDESEREETS